MNSLRTLSWHSRHHHLSFKLLTFLEIEVSMNDACRYDISNEMVFAISRGSNCSENEDESREAALTIHVNVDEVARHSTIRNSRIVTLLEQLSYSNNVRDDNLKRRDEREVHVSTLGDKPRTKVTTDFLSEVVWGRIIWHKFKLVLTRDGTSSLDSYHTELSYVNSGTSDDRTYTHETQFTKTINVTTLHTKRRTTCQWFNHTKEKVSASKKNVTQTIHNQIDEWADDQKFNKRFFSVQFGIGPFFFQANRLFVFDVLFSQSSSVSPRFFVTTSGWSVLSDTSTFRVFSSFFTKSSPVWKINRRSFPLSTTTQKIRLSIWLSK